MAQYVAQVDPSNDREVVNAIVLPDGVDPLTYVAALGLPGTWEPMPGKTAGVGMVHAPGSGFHHRWVQVVGAGGGPPEAESGYSSGFKVFHAGLVWFSTVDFNVWEPGIANWHREDGEWVQPTGATDAYALDAVVTRNGQTWRSLYAANVWEPGVFGWELLA